MKSCAFCKNLKIYFPYPCDTCGGSPTFDCKKHYGEEGEEQTPLYSDSVYSLESETPLKIFIKYPEKLRPN